MQCDITTYRIQLRMMFHDVIDYITQDTIIYLNLTYTGGEFSAKANS